jgi:UDP-glucose 4-epimerase
MVAPNFVRQALAGKRLTVYGGGEQTRCFCDVRDVVRAVSALSRCAEANGQVFNIGSMREMSIRSLAEQIIAATGSSSDIEYIPFNEVYYEGFEDIARRVPDTGKVGSMIAWRPEIELEQTIEEIIEAERSAKSESAAVRRTTAV